MINVHDKCLTKIPFSAGVEIPSNAYDRHNTRICKNNSKTRLRRFAQKTTSAFTEYPAKGLKGDPNSDFYEFLTMGTVPYVIGSLMFMGLFNGASKYFDPFSKKAASNIGNRLALGVLFYGLAKNLAKPLITKPVKWATGIDTQLPYENVVFTIPSKPGETDLTKIQQRTAYDSVEFPRFDLLYGDDSHKNPYNKYFDGIAKKLNLGDNLPASDSEVKPIIKNVVARTTSAKYISSYLWAATGVALALQEPWINFFNALSPKKWSKFYLDNGNKLIGKVKNFGSNMRRIGLSFFRNLKESAKELYSGPIGTKGFKKNAGKILIGIAAASTLFGILNTVIGAKNTAKQNKKTTIDKTKQYTVL